MLDHFTAPQMQRIDRENTERGNLRTAEAWLEQYELRDMRSQHELTAAEYARELRRCVYFAVAMIAAVYGLLSIGGM